jgi:hypothetical protein
MVPEGNKSYAGRLRLFASPLLAMATGLRATWTQQLLLPSLLTDLAYVAALCGFLYGAAKLRRQNASLLYVVAVVFPFVYALSSWTYADIEPRYLMALMPVLALLLAQVARRFSTAVLVLACACAVTIVNLQRMNDVALAPQTYPPANRSMAPLVATLERLGYARVYAGYEIAYRLDFDTKEQIIAVMNKSPLVFSAGQATPKPRPGFIRWPAYDAIVRASPHAFVFYRQEVRASVVIPNLRRDGYRAYGAGPYYVVYVPRSKPAG